MITAEESAWVQMVGERFGAPLPLPIELIKDFGEPVLDAAYFGIAEADLREPCLVCERVGFDCGGHDASP